MIDMAGNINDIMNMYQQMKSSKNPVDFLAKKFNIPQDMNDPNAIIQHLLNTGQVSQAQVNNVMQMRNNPMIQKMFGMR